MAAQLLGRLLAGELGNSRPLNFYAAFFPCEVLVNLEAVPAGTASPELLSVTRVMCCKADQPPHLHAVL